MSLMGHPSVVRPLGLGCREDGKVAALLMLLYGSILRTWIERSQPAKLSSTVVEQPLRWAGRAYLIQVVSGLAHVRSRGIVHLDIKLENILVTGLHLAIADLGVCHGIARDDFSPHGVPHGRLLASEVNT